MDPVTASFTTGIGMLRIAFPLLGRGSWTGGYVYLKNTLRLVRKRLADKIEAHVFLNMEEAERYGQELSPLVDGRLIVDPAIAVAGRGPSLLKALAFGSDRKLAALLQRHGIETVFELAGFYGSHFPIPVISWIPDFQHCHMPHMFSRPSWWRRDIGFRMQVNSGRTVMLSSYSARADLERFYPKAKAKRHVVRFAIELEVDKFLARGAEMRATYGLPERYFFLPNQFWRHKNHGVIVEALSLIRAQGKMENLPPIILSGLTVDPRAPSYFDEVMARAKAQGVNDHFRHLGLVPYDDVLSLNANCLAMINPSLFEGWSTPIEEAKAFATPLLLSDIPINREQAPDAYFFAAESPQKVADALLATATEKARTRPQAAILMANQYNRLDEYANSLLRAIEIAVT